MAHDAVAAAPSEAPSGIKMWLMAARPKTLTAAAVPVIVGSSLAYAHGTFRPLAALAAIGVAFFLQIGTNLANDLFDFKKGTDNEERLGPVRVTSAGLVSPRRIAIACAITFALAFVCGLYLVSLTGWPLLVLGLVCIASGVAYTGGPFPLAYNALGDVFVFIFFGFVATVGTYYTQALTISTMAFLMSIPARLMKPSSAMKPNGCPVASNPHVTPITASGTHSQIISGWRNALKSMITVRTINIRKRGIVELRPACASPELSYSPPYSMK